LAYAEFMRGYRLSSSGDHALLEEAVERLSNAVTRDPSFALAHATLSLACATRYLEVDPASKWSEKAEFHCARALELSRDLPEAHVAKAFLLWSPLKNFQHLEAIIELRKAIALQKNLPRAYNRLGTILAHIGLLDRAREMYEKGRPFQPKKAVNHSVVQVYLWKHELDLAAREIQAWQSEGLSNKYVIYFAAQHALMSALIGNTGQALECVTRACSSAKSFGHAHHIFYQIACIFSLLDRREVAFEWLERSVNTGFACWPFFLKDICLQNLRGLPEFDTLVSSLQVKYPDHLGLL
jgi:tetratricopeptide (TPR) repeat protein